MQFTKRISVGAFLKKGVDVKDGDLVTITNEGKQIEGQFGTQDVFMVKLQDGSKEGNLALNTTSINNLIDAFGTESRNWVGKQVKIWIIRSNVGGKIMPVLYVSHPNADLDDNGQFVLSTPHLPSTPNTQTEVTPDDIPF